MLYLAIETNGCRINVEFNCLFLARLAMRNNVMRRCGNILQYFQILINFMHKGLLCKYLTNPEDRYAKVTHLKYFLLL